MFHERKRFRKFATNNMKITVFLFLIVFVFPGEKHTFPCECYIRSIFTINSSQGVWPYNTTQTLYQTMWKLYRINRLHHFSASLLYLPSHSIILHHLPLFSTPLHSLPPLFQSHKGSWQWFQATRCSAEAWEETWC